MSLADTANLIINLTLKDQATGQLTKTTTGLSGLQKAALGVATLGFGAMTKGALQAEEAQGKFMAATGKSREEAKKFVSGMDSLAGSAGAVGLSFEEIAETGTMVEQQFGTTGQATTDLTDDILEFAKVTGSDAEQAAADLEDTLSAFGLSADDASGFMDKLVASNQKFGTEAGPETLSILQGMAPALEAMGMGLDDGVELLNAFEVAGLDAGTAQRGLQTAVKELKPGENLDDLIAQIGAIEDPTKRAQKAIEIFGTKAGVGLAQVIKPGMTSLDDFGISAEDASGSLDQAAEDMLTTSDKIRGMLEKLGAGFREGGQMFGPLISGVAGLGTLLAPAMGKAWDVLKDSSVVRAAVSAAGVAAGAIYAGATKVGEALLAPVTAAWTAMGRPGSAVLTAAAGSGSLAGAAFVGAAVLAIPAGAAAIGTSLSHELDKFLFPGGSVMSGMQAQADAAMQRYGEQAGAVGGQAAAAALPTTFTRTLTMADFREIVPHFEHVGQTVADATGQGFNSKVPQLIGHGRDGMRGMNNAMIAEAAHADKVGRALANGLLDSLPSTHDAWNQYLEQSRNMLNPMKEIAWLQARLAGDKLAQGLNSKNPLQRAAAETMRDTIMARIGELNQLMGIEGTQASNSLGRNMDSGPAVSAARAIMQRLAAIFDKQFTVGVGVKAGTGKGKKAAGEHVGGGGRAHGGPVAGNSIYEVNELGAPEMLTAGGRNYLLMGRHGGNVTPFMPGGGVSRGGGAMTTTLNVNLFLNGYQIAQAQEHFRRTQGGQPI